MNLRPKKDVRSFPARDDIPADILTSFSDQKTYQISCYAFFTALFEAPLEQLLARNDTQAESGNPPLEWVQQMCDMRHDPDQGPRHEFFGSVQQKHQQV